MSSDPNTDQPCNVRLWWSRCAILRSYFYDASINTVLGSIYTMLVQVFSPTHSREVNPVTKPTLNIKSRV